MKRTKKHKVEREVVVALVCDVCGAEAPNPGDSRCWSDEPYGIAETEPLRLEEGSSFPEGGYSVSYEYDICPDCFRDELIPWLKGLGVDREPVEVDW